MISYELAKKLKDEGFPQEPFWQVDVNAWGGSWYYLYKPEACAMPVFANPDDYKKGIERGDILVKISSLSELIEAVRNVHPVKLYNGELFNLESHCMHDFGYEAKLTIIVSLESFEEKEWKVWADTPEEAVANLWIKLNK